MKRRNSKAKVLALAAMCAICSGGVSGLTPVYATSTLAIDVATAGELKVGTDSKITGTITLHSYAFTQLLDMNLGDVRISSGGIRLGALENLVGYSTGDKTVITAGDGSTIGDVGFNNGAVTGVKSINANDNSAKFKVTEDGSNYTFRAGNLKITTGKENGVLNGEITFADTNRPNKSDEITLSKIIDTANYAGGIQRSSEKDRHGTPREVTSIENQVKIRDDGRVEINTTGSNSEQSVVIDSGHGILVGHADQVKKLLDQDSNVTDEQKKAYLNKTAGISYDGVFAGGIKFEDAKAGMSNVDGSLKAASGKFKVDSDGAISAANGEFKVDKEGTLTTKKLITDELVITGSGAAGGTTTGTLDGSNLTLKDGSSKTNITAGGATFTKDGKTTTISSDTISTDGTLSVAGGKFTVGADGSFSAADGKFKIDNTGTITAGSMKMDKIEASDASKGIDVGGVILKDKSITAADGKFKVDADGKVIINERTKNQVKIDSNGIKVGNNSAFISDDGFKSSGDLYIGTKTAPTENATDARFYVKGSDGSVKAADGKFTVEADGGFTAADGKFKVTGDGNLEVQDAAGNSKSINLSDVADMGQDIARMNHRISDVSDRVNKVGAMSAALASLKTIGYDPEAPTEFSVGLGQYKGESGVALGIFHYPNKNFLLNLSLSTAGGETMGGIGATWRIGHGAPQKQLEVAVKEDVEKVIVKKEDYEALQEQVNQLTQMVQQLVADKEAAAAK